MGVLLAGRYVPPCSVLCCTWHVALLGCPCERLAVTRPAGDDQEKGYHVPTAGVDAPMLRDLTKKSRTRFLPPAPTSAWPPSQRLHPTRRRKIIINEQNSSQIKKQAVSSTPVELTHQNSLRLRPCYLSNILANRLCRPNSETPKQRVAVWRGRYRSFRRA